MQLQQQNVIHWGLNYLCLFTDDFLCEIAKYCIYNYVNLLYFNQHSLLHVAATMMAIFTITIQAVLLLPYIAYEHTIQHKSYFHQYFIF